MDAWEQLISNSTLETGDAWEHLQNQQGGGSGGPLVLIDGLEVLMQDANVDVEIDLEPIEVEVEDIDYELEIETPEYDVEVS